MSELTQANWAHLFHAYGLATDTPEYLATLQQSEEAAHSACLYHLNSAILHQETVWTATAPATAILLGYFADNSLQVNDDIRTGLLSFLLDLSVVLQQIPQTDWVELDELAKTDLSSYWVEDFDLEVFFEDEPAANAAFAQSLCACRALLPQLSRTFSQASHHPNPNIRAMAVEGLRICAG